MCLVNDEDILQIIYLMNNNNNFELILYSLFYGVLSVMIYFMSKLLVEEVNNFTDFKCKVRKRLDGGWITI